MQLELAYGHRKLYLELKDNLNARVLKGQDLVNEVDEASKYWDFDLLSFESVTDPRGRVAVLSRVRPKASESKRTHSERTTR